METSNCIQTNAIAILIPKGSFNSIYFKNAAAVWQTFWGADFLLRGSLPHYSHEIATKLPQICPIRWDQ